MQNNCDNIEQNNSSPLIIEKQDISRYGYYLASMRLTGDLRACAENIASVMRVQNNCRAGKRVAGFAPVKWTELEGSAELSFCVKAFGYDLQLGSLRRLYKNDDAFVQGLKSSGIYDYQFEDYYVNSLVNEYINKLFNNVVSIRELQTDIAHQDDMQIMLSFDKVVPNAYFSSRNYPTTEDILSAGKQQSSVLGTQSDYARKSPYFSAVLTTKDAFFDAKAMAAACRALNRNASILIAPQAVVRLEDGRYRMLVAGMKRQRLFSSPAAASESDADPIGYYLASDVQMHLYGNTAADGEDIVEAEHIADIIESLPTPEPEDFRVIDDPTVLNNISSSWKGGAADGSPELSGEEELDGLIGLEHVKEQIREFVDFAAEQKRRGGQVPVLHAWMTGNPGTGKTTVARIIAHMMYDKGLIPKRNVFVEGDRETLVGQYIGETAVKTKRAISRARHGVLFIDEAYALAGNSAHDYGEEAISTLVKAMEDCQNDFERNGFVCIMAGYTKPMEEMISINPGLRDRFAFHLEFPDYSAKELVQVFSSFARKSGLKVSPAARREAEAHFSTIVKRKDENFSNARLVRKIFDRCRMRQSRLGGGDCIKKEAVLSAFEDKDFKRLLEGRPNTLRVGFAS